MVRVFILLLIAGFPVSVFASSPLEQKWCKGITNDVKVIFYDYQKGKTKEESLRTIEAKQQDPFAVLLLRQMADITYTKSPRLTKPQERDAVAAFMDSRVFDDCLKAIEKFKSRPVQ